MPGTKILYQEQKDEIQALDSAGNKVAYISYEYKQLGDNAFLSVEQVTTEPAFRGQGIAKKLLLKVINKAIAEEKALHMLIQPGSARFYKQFFNQYFNTKKITLFGKTDPLSKNLRDGAIVEISAEDLAKQYKFPVDKKLRDQRLEKTCQEYTRTHSSRH